LKGTWELTIVRLKLLVRNRAAIFFSIIFPVLFLYIYGFLFAKGDTSKVRFLMGPVVVLTILGSGFWGVGFQIVFFREKNILRRFRPAPVGAMPLIASGVLANWVLQIFVVGLEFELAWISFHVPWPGHLLELFVVGTLGLFAFAGIGMVVASITNTMQETQIINNIFWSAFLFLSGASIPLAKFPGWMQRVALFSPALPRLKCSPNFQPPVGPRW
jgi:ABC-2 type transport system permease protein